jgi:hypothetical protein
MFVFVFAEKLLNSEGRELRRALFSLKQIFQVSLTIRTRTIYVGSARVLQVITPGSLLSQGHIIP